MAALQPQNDADRILLGGPARAADSSGGGTVV